MIKKEIPSKSKILKEIRKALTIPLNGNVCGVFDKKGWACYNKTDLGMIMECVQVGICEAFKDEV